MKIGRASKIFRAKELLEVAADKRYRVSRTPFGATYADPLVYVGKAVDWKGFKKGEKDFDTYISELEKINRRVAKGLKNARKMAKEKAADVKGVVCIVDEVTGMPKVIPRAAYVLMKEAGKVPQTVPVM